MIKKFKWIDHPQKEFLKWAKQEFPDLKAARQNGQAHPGVEKRLIELNEAAMSVLDFVMSYCSESTKRYYKQDFIALSNAFAQRDAINYTVHLDSFLDAIEVE